MCRESVLAGETFVSTKIIAGGFQRARPRGAHSRSSAKAIFLTPPGLAEGLSSCSARKRARARARARNRRRTWGDCPSLDKLPSGTFTGTGTRTGETNRRTDQLWLELQPPAHAQPEVAHGVDRNRGDVLPQRLEPQAAPQPPGDRPTDDALVGETARHRG